MEWTPGVIPLREPLRPAVPVAGRFPVRRALPHAINHLGRIAGSQP